MYAQPIINVDLDLFVPLTLMEYQLVLYFSHSLIGLQWAILPIQFFAPLDILDNLLHQELGLANLVLHQTQIFSQVLLYLVIALSTIIPQMESQFKTKFQWVVDIIKIQVFTVPFKWEMHSSQDIFMIYSWSHMKLTKTVMFL